MAYLLNIIYLALLALFTPWFVYSSIRHGKYREGFSQKFLGRVPVRSGRRPCIWFHGVSVGEINLLNRLIQRIENQWPNVECVVSTTTKAGYDLAMRLYAPRTVFYCPADFSWAVKNALGRLRPSLLVLVELELWPNLIAAAKSQGVRTAIINGRLSQRSSRGYARIRPVVSHILRNVDLIAVQNDEYRARFQTLGADPNTTVVTGSIKFDGAETDRQNAATCRLVGLWGTRPDDVVFLAGSTQDPEESMALECFKLLKPSHPKLKLIIVPRHPQRFDEVANLLARSGIAWQRRSELDAGTVGTPAPASVLLVDTVGELSAWWGTAQIGLVGGSFGARGGQSMIEPAAYGVAVSFGPNTRNFREIVELLLVRNAAHVVHSGDDLTAFVRSCLESPAFAIALGRRSQQLVVEQRGAIERTMKLLLPLLPPQSELAVAAAEAA